MSKLPDKPSELIRVALKDIRACEASDKYLIDMCSWHARARPGFNLKCAVCFAGAVMAQTLGADPERDYHPSDFDGDTNSKMYALDRLRVGDVEGAIRELGVRSVEEEGILDERQITRYKEDPVKFKEEMEQLANDLETAGF